MKFKENAKITTSDFWYDITDGGYIKPEKLLENPDEAEMVNNAINVLKQFRNEAENNNVIEWM